MISKHTPQGLDTRPVQPILKSAERGRAGAQACLDKAWSGDVGHAKFHLELKDGRDAQKGSLNLVEEETVERQHCADTGARAARQCLARCDTTHPSLTRAYYRQPHHALSRAGWIM